MLPWRRPVRRTGRAKNRMPRWALGQCNRHIDVAVRAIVAPSGGAEGREGADRCPEFGLMGFKGRDNPAVTHRLPFGARNAGGLRARARRSNATSVFDYSRAYIDRPRPNVDDKPQQIIGRHVADRLSTMSSGW